MYGRGLTINFSIFQTVQQSSYYGLSSMLPRRYTQAVMAGESVAGVIEIGLRIVTKAFFQSVRAGAILFFSISLCFIVFCIFCQVYVKRSAIVVFYTKKCRDDDSDRSGTLAPRRHHPAAVGGGAGGGAGGEEEEGMTSDDDGGSDQQRLLRNGGGGGGSGGSGGGGGGEAMELLSLKSDGRVSRPMDTFKARRRSKLTALSLRTYLCKSRK